MQIPDQIQQDHPAGFQREQQHDRDGRVGIIDGKHHRHGHQGPRRPDRARRIMHGETEQHVEQTREDRRHQVERQKLALPPQLFNRGAEHPQHPHVEHDMPQAMRVVQKGVGQQSPDLTGGHLVGIQRAPRLQDRRGAVQAQFGRHLVEFGISALLHHLHQGRLLARARSVKQHPNVRLGHREKHLHQIRGDGDDQQGLAHRPAGRHRPAARCRVVPEVIAVLNSHDALTQQRIRAGCYSLHGRQ